jgi:hypothetical protein
MNWIKVLTILNAADIFGEPEMGYGVAFTPSAFEQEMIRRDSDLRGGYCEAQEGQRVPDERGK